MQNICHTVDVQGVRASPATTKQYNNEAVLQYPNHKYNNLRKMNVNILQWRYIIQKRAQLG